MPPMGAAQSAAKELLHSIIDSYIWLLLESKSSQHAPMNTPKSMVTEISGNPDSESSRDTGGYTIGFSMTVLQDEAKDRPVAVKGGEIIEYYLCTGRGQKLENEDLQPIQAVQITKFCNPLKINQETLKVE
ncbi:hypothetical protein L2E82_26467 [Cichorium intybus]|uniref:Uncharacterized protein n=1 Tax=Cichorium intybus TaxID=13427 RepID=A0ACB9CQJ7_CICIN|nr:hypothetical protein L2E82_26467 [Cichorium intybus]